MRLPSRGMRDQESVFPEGIGKTKRGPRRRGRHARRKNDHRERKKKEKYSPSLSPIPKKTDISSKKSIPLSPKAHRPSRELEGSDRISIEKMLLGALQPTSAESSRRLEVPHLSHSDLGC